MSWPEMVHGKPALLLGWSNPGISSCTAQCSPIKHVPRTMRSIMMQKWRRGLHDHPWCSCCWRNCYMHLCPGCRGSISELFSLLYSATIIPGTSDSHCLIHPTFYATVLHCIRPLQDDQEWGQCPRGKVDAIGSLHTSLLPFSFSIESNNLPAFFAEFRITFVDVMLRTSSTLSSNRELMMRGLYVWLASHKQDSHQVQQTLTYCLCRDCCHPGSEWQMMFCNRLLQGPAGLQYDQCRPLWLKTCCSSNNDRGKLMMMWWILQQ